MTYSNFDRGNVIKNYVEGEDLSNDEKLLAEKQYYYEVLERIIKNPRFYLDNLEELDVFRCTFIFYKPSKDLNLGYLYTEEGKVYK